MEKITFTGSLDMISKRLSFYKDQGVYDCVVSLHHEHRSRNANNYLWALCTELANVLRLSKDEIYLMMLERYGQSVQVAVRSDIDLSASVKYSRKGETVRSTTYWTVYKGSSEMDTHEMAILLDGVVQECEEQGIQTISDDELKSMEANWG